MRTVETYRYGTVLINGARDDLTKFAIELRKVGYQVGRPTARILCVDDVSEEELQVLAEASKYRDCHVAEAKGRHDVSRRVRRKKAAKKVELSPKTWYFAEHLEDSYPLVYVRATHEQPVLVEAAAGEDPVEEEITVVQMDLVDADGSMPRSLSADAREVDDYGLRLATEEDFTDRDLPVPAELRLQRTTAGAPDKAHVANFRGKLL
jgi:hypothetical protein